MAETAQIKRPYQRVFARVEAALPLRAAEDEAAPPAPRPRKKSWPVLEIVLVLLLVKVLIGVFFMLFSEGEKSDPFFPAINQAEAAPPVVTNALSASPLAAGAALSLAPAAASAPVSAGTAVLTEAAVLAAPAASSSLTASSAANAMAGGAALVLAGAQGWSDNPALRMAEAIPLPPDSADLLTPTRSQAPVPPASAVSEPAPGPAATNTAPPVRVENYQRDQELARREADLGARERALYELESELEQKLRAIESGKSEIEDLTRRNQEILAEQRALREQQLQDDQLLKDARIEHLVTAYKSMKAEQAGVLISSMDDDIAVAILSAMPGRNAGLILANVVPEKAARLTKAISEKRVDPRLLLEESGNTPPME